MAKPALHIQGMHGKGDNVHQRAILRQLMKTHRIWLESSWASVYHDLVGDDLTLVRRPVALRTQTKNANREAALFTNVLPPNGACIRISTPGEVIRSCESKTILEAMCIVAGVNYAEADFTLPVPEAWVRELERVVELREVAKPILVYRPLCYRTEYPGSGLRNADPECYARIFAAIRDHFFVVSIADLEPGREWIVGPQLRADVAFHSGELNFEAMAALFKAADVVFTSSGFPAILAPAVGTPVVSIIGGYELPDCHASALAREVGYLGIGPPNPCQCWTSQCRRVCDKRLDVSAAIDQVRQFLSQKCIHISDAVERPITEMFDMPEGVEPPATPFGASPRTQLDALFAQMQRQGLKA